KSVTAALSRPRIDARAPGPRGSCINLDRLDRIDGENVQRDRALAIDDDAAPWIGCIAHAELRARHANGVVDPFDAESLEIGVCVDAAAAEASPGKTV